MHPDETTLIQFALGTLDKKDARRVDRALSASKQLREQLDEIQESLHGVAIAEPPIRAGEQLKQRIMTSITREQRFLGFSDRFAELFDVAGDRARQLLEKIDQPLADGWTSTALLPGVGIFEFPGGTRVGSATCGLICVEPGTVFPRHQHQGEEWMLVLQGQARESDGRILKPGDLVRSEAGSEHAFRVLSTEAYVFAVLLESDNKWLIGQSLLDRMFGNRRFPPERER